MRSGGAAVAYTDTNTFLCGLRTRTDPLRHPADWSKNREQHLLLVPKFTLVDRQVTPLTLRKTVLPNLRTAYKHIPETNCVIWSWSKSPEGLINTKAHTHELIPFGQISNQIQAQTITSLTDSYYPGPLFEIKSNVMNNIPNQPYSQMPSSSTKTTELQYNSVIKTDIELVKWVGRIERYEVTDWSGYGNWNWLDIVILKDNSSVIE